MPHYHFLTRHNKEVPMSPRLSSTQTMTPPSTRPGRVLGETLRQAAQERRLLDEEIEVCRDDGTVIAVVVCDGNLRH